MTRAGRPASSRAFTLVEAALSVAVVGVMTVAATGTFGAIARHRRIQTESRLGTLIGQQLMSEVLQTPFQRATGTAFGPLPGQTRPAFDAVDAYDGYAAKPPVTQAGGAMADYAGWTEAVAVTYADVATLANTAAVTSLKKVTVTVTSPAGKPYVLVGLRSKFSVGEQVPAVQTRYVTGVSVSLKAASPTKTVYAGAHPLNVTTSQ